MQYYASQFEQFIDNSHMHSVLWKILASYPPRKWHVYPMRNTYIIIISFKFPKNLLFSLFIPFVICFFAPFILFCTEVWREYVLYSNGRLSQSLHPNQFCKKKYLNETTRVHNMQMSPKKLGRLFNEKRTWRHAILSNCIIYSVSKNQ